MARAKATHASVTFEVAGRGDFPIDMLRYDMAAPYTGSDVTGIMNRKLEDVPGAGLYHTREVERRVKLCRFYPVGGKPEPEFARWASFGWRVVAVEGRSL